MIGIVPKLVPIPIVTSKPIASISIAPPILPPATALAKLTSCSIPPLSRKTEPKPAATSMINAIKPIIARPLSMILSIFRYSIPPKTTITSSPKSAPSGILSV